MNQLGIIVDVAHCSEATVAGVVRPRRSRSCAPTPTLRSRGIPDGDHPRYISPEYARMVVDTGGVIGAWIAVLWQEKLPGMIRQLFRLIDAVGIDHVGIGTDLPAGAAKAEMPDFSRHAEIAAALRAQRHDRGGGGEGLRRQLAAGVPRGSRLMDRDAQKRAAAEAAAAMVEDGMVVGLGTGSTAQFAIEALIRRVARRPRIRAIPTSERSAAQARAGGIPLTSFAEHRRIDLTIDGADEIELGTLNLIKGLGGALLREKIVAAASERLVIVADGTEAGRTAGRNRAGAGRGRAVRLGDDRGSAAPSRRRSACRGETRPAIFSLPTAATASSTAGSA